MPAFSQEFDINSFFVAQNGVFKYHIPDEEDEQTEEQSQNLKTDEVIVKEDIVSDDVTADTSGISKYDSDQEISNEDDYELEDMYGYVLHGYAEYFDDEENAISLDLPENEYLVLNIKKPVAIEGKYFGYLQSSPSLFDNNYTKYKTYDIFGWLIGDTFTILESFDESNSIYYYTFCYSTLNSRYYFNIRQVYFSFDLPERK